MSRARLARIAPFILFIAFLALRGAVPMRNPWGLDPRWIYGVAVVCVGALLWVFRRDYDELAASHRPTVRELLLAVAAGLVVFALWIQLDARWMMLAEPTAVFFPLDADGAIEWSLVVVRWIGATLLVPVMEELFWRSFVMRWIHDARFEHLAPQAVGAKALLMSTALFVLAHTQWLAAAIAGLVYAWLYIRTGKLWVAIVAHAVTNGVLGVWVVMTGQWLFW